MLAGLLGFIRIEAAVVVAVETLDEFGRCRHALPRLLAAETFAEFLPLLGRDKAHEFAVQFRLSLTTLTDEVGFLIHQRAPRAPDQDRS